MVPAGIRREAKSVHERYGLDKLTLVPNADRLADHREDEEVMWYSGLGLLVTWASVSDRTKLDGIERYLGDYYAPLVPWSGARFPDVDPVDLAVRRRWTYILDGLYDGRSVSGGGAWHGACYRRAPCSTLSSPGTTTRAPSRVSN